MSAWCRTASIPPQRPCVRAYAPMKEDGRLSPSPPARPPDYSRTSCRSPVFSSRGERRLLRQRAGVPPRTRRRRGTAAVGQQYALRDATPDGSIAPIPAVRLTVCCSALWRRTNCLNEHRYTRDCNDLSEQDSKRSERVAGRFCHLRTNAIMRPTPVAGCQRRP
jgi:hypothetical protein